MIWGHPTILAAFSNYMTENDIKPIEVDLIATYGEKVYPHIRDTISKAFKCRFAEYYGNRENTIGARGNWNDRFYEISEYCHLELENSNMVENNPGAGELISTSLHNYAVPLIRYNSEDIVTFEDSNDSDAISPVIHLIGGRGKDVLLSRTGLVAPYIPNYLWIKANNRIRKFQYFQENLGEITIKIVPLPSFNRINDEPELIKSFSGMLGDKFKISIEYVKDIPFTKAGKYPMAVSKLAVDYLKKNSAE